MRRVTDLDAWIAQQRRATTVAIAEMAEQPPAVRRKPRVEGEHDVLALDAMDAAERFHSEGRLVRLGPRHYELRPR